ncbi:type VI immunity family protein [Rhodobacter aestuarii]|uniref:type VI immunity family protein n=1 Tax=Rhodobacter aestuarii TaxID=453582 RepID=UPI00158D25F0|nr:type VI immunity family protein [Rhodobacter aestuarii]
MVELVEEFLKFPGCRIEHFASNNGKRCRLKQIAKLPEQAVKVLEDPPENDLYFSLYEDLGGDYLSTPLWETWGFAFGKNRQQRPLSGIHFHVPPEFLLKNTETFLGFSCWCAENTGVIHGTVGLGVLGGIGSEDISDSYWYPWLQAYPGLEYEASGLYWSETRKGGHDLPRSSNWLTILGDENIARLGGEAQIRRQLTDGMSFLPFKGGAIIRACEKPALGNAASGGIPEGYRTAARIIKPIRFEGYQRGIIKTPKELGFTREQDLQVTLEWVRRFD